MELGRVGIWTAVFEAQPAAVAQAAAGELEQLGYRTLWLNETTGREPFVMASLVLSATESLNVALGIANVYARDAMTTKAAQYTLSEAFPDRFLLGLGVSSPALVGKVRGHDYVKPLTYMKSYLETIDQAPYHSVAPKVTPPRVLGALGPKMVELAGTHAAGAHPYLTTPEHTRAARDILGEGPILAPEQMVVLESDPEKARQIARTTLNYYLRAPGYLGNLRRLGFDDTDWSDPRAASDRLVDALVAWGDVEQAAERIQQHLDAGADHVAVQVLRGDTAVPMDEWRLLAKAVL